MERVISVLPDEIIQQLDILLSKVIEVRSADKGTLQIYEPQKEMLHIVSHRGFNSDFLNHFKCVKRFDSSACGRAAGIGNIVNINDVTNDKGFKSHSSTALTSGVQAVQSIPLFDDGELIGVVSVHFNEPKQRITRAPLATVSS